MALFVVSLAVVCLMVEIGLRYVNCPPYPVKPMPAMYAQDDELGFVLRKNSNFTYSTIDFSVSIHSNSYGIRDVEHKHWKPGSGAIVVGDSFAFGHGVKIEKTFASLLEYNLKIDIVKAGMESYGPRQSYIMMQRMVKQYPPKFVIFTFYEGNDWGDDLYMYPYHNIHSGYLVRPGDKQKVGELHALGEEAARKKEMLFLATNNKLLAESKFYRWIRYKLLLAGLIHNPFFKTNKDGSYDCPLPIYTTYLKMGFTEDNGDGTRQWKLTTTTLLDAKKFANKNRIKLIVIIIPDKIQACDELRERLVSNCNNLRQFSNPKVYNFESAGRKLSDFLKQNKVEVINMLPRFKKNRHPDRIYFPFDPHLSPYGQTLIADEIAKKISRM